MGEDVEKLTHFSDLNNPIADEDINQHEIKFENPAAAEVPNNRSIGIGRGRGRGLRVKTDENFISRQLQEHVGLLRWQNQHQDECRRSRIKRNIFGAVVRKNNEMEVVVPVLVKTLPTKEVVNTVVKRTLVNEDNSSGSFITCNS